MLQQAKHQFAVLKEQHKHEQAYLATLFEQIYGKFFISVLTTLDSQFLSM
jgi:hypothetical protein